MAEELHNDPLEGFFKNAFEGFEAEPDNEMWGQIKASIPPKPVSAWWLFFRKWQRFGLLLIGSVAIFVALWQYQQKRQLATQLERQKGEISALQEQLTALQEQSQNMPGNAGGERQEKMYPQERTLQTSTTTVQHPTTRKETKTLRLSSSFVTEAPVSFKPESQALEQVGAAEPELKSKKAGSPIDTASQTSIHLSANLQVGPLLNLTGKGPAFLPDELPTESLLELVKTKEKPGPVFYYGTHAEALFYNQDLNYRRQALVGGAKVASMGWGFGITAGLQLGKRFGIQSGLGFRWYNFRFQDAVNLVYTSENTTTNSAGQIVGNYAIASLGGVELSTRIKNSVQQDELDISDGDIFSLVYDLNYQLRYYTIPLQVTYGLGNGRWKTQFRTGVLLHTTLGEKLNERFVNLSHSRLSPAGMELEIASLRSSFLELAAGAQVQYQWTSKMELGLGTTWYHTLTPMAEESHTSLGIDLSFNYKFTAKESKR